MELSVLDRLISDVGIGSTITLGVVRGGRRVEVRVPIVRPTGTGRSGNQTPAGVQPSKARYAPRVALGRHPVRGAISADILEFRARVLVSQVATGGYGRAPLISDTVLPVYSGALAIRLAVASSRTGPRVPMVGYR